MKKSLIAQVLSIVVIVIGAYSFNFSGTTLAVLGVVSFSITQFLATFMPSGTWVAGWHVTSWIVNVAGVLIQILNLMGEQALISPMLLNQIIIGLNLIVAYIGKNYPKVG